MTDNFLKQVQARLAARTHNVPRIGLSKLDTGHAKHFTIWPDYYQGNTLIFLLFIAYVVFWYLQGGVRFPALGSIRLEFIMGAILTGFGIQAYLANSNKQSSGVRTWVTLLFLIMAIMIPLSYVPDVSFDIFINRVIKFALMGLFIAAFVTTPNRLKWFIAAFLFACMKMGEEGLIGNITGGLVWENQGIPRLHGATPNYAHPNSFSGMALGTLPFVYYFYQVSPWYLRLILLVQLVFAINIIIFTGSRTGYMGLASGAAYLIWKSANRKRAILLAFIGAFVIIQLVPNEYVERAESIFTGKEKEGASIHEREGILKDAWQIFLDHPLGIGIHAFPAVREARFGKTQDTHNLYLEIATNLGIQGLTVFFGFIYALFRTLTQLSTDVSMQIEKLEHILLYWRRNNPIPDSWRNHVADLHIIRATARATVAFILIRLSLGFFGMDLYEIYWWFALGITVAIWNLNVVATRRTDQIYTISTEPETQ